MLIDAALKLCLEQGYERTTVDQIAAIADVSPRTFSRYFPTKDAVVLTLIDDLTEAAAVELTKVPRDVPHMEALVRANVEVLRAVPSGSVEGLTAERLALMLNITNSVGALRRAASDWRPSGISRNLARRMGVADDDRRVKLAMAVWIAVVVTGWADIVLGPHEVESGPARMIEGLLSAFAEFSELTEKLPHLV